MVNRTCFVSVRIVLSVSRCILSHLHVTSSHVNAFHKPCRFCLYLWDEYVLGTADTLIMIHYVVIVITKQWYM
jgi:hypothetical protein